MPDTRRELAALQTLLADNSSGDISAQDARDVLISESPSFVHPTSAFASPPATPVTGDKWMPSDGFCFYRYDGSVWVPWGPIFPLTDPTLKSWSWVNQGSASVSTTNGGIYLSSPSNGVAYNWRLRLLASLSTPYTVTVMSLPLATSYNSSTAVIGGAAPIVLYDGTKLTTCGPFVGDLTYEITDWNSLSSYNTSAAYVGSQSGFSANGIMFPWVQFTDDGTNHIWKLSNDGINFYTWFTRARAAFLSGSNQQIGFGVNPYNQIFGINILSWK